MIWCDDREQDTLFYCAPLPRGLENSARNLMRDGGSRVADPGEDWRGPRDKSNSKRTSKNRSGSSLVKKSALEFVIFNYDDRSCWRSLNYLRYIKLRKKPDEDLGIWKPFRPWAIFPSHNPYCRCYKTIPLYTHSLFIILIFFIFSFECARPEKGIKIWPLTPKP